jgi:MerR family transcriptional regulator, light-induced transcriptional regulator
MAVIKEKKDLTKDQQGIRISAVSKITGIPTDTLRAWERRYHLVTPNRVGKASRAYSKEDVQKLTLIKKLVDHGHAISNLAAQSTDELNALLALHNPAASNAEILSRAVRIIVCGEVLASTFKHEKITDPRIDIQGLFSSAVAAGSALNKIDIDVLVLEYDSLHKDKVFEIVDIFRRSKAKYCFISYAFSNQLVIDQLEGQGFILCRAPLKSTGLIEMIMATMPVELESAEIENETIDLSKAPAKPDFSTENLVALASMDSALNCECPQHLADLILNLTRFEIYSADCENRSEDDAKLHHYLAQVAGHSRSILETALHKVVEAEGLKLDA